MIDRSRRGQQSTLVSRNVTIAGHRTSIRLEADMWEALFEICRREGKTVHAICSVVDGQRFASHRG
jgi:predicted DNA-binding ribbon-helix-helix protein